MPLLPHLIVKEQVSIRRHIGSSKQLTRGILPETKTASMGVLPSIEAVAHERKCRGTIVGGILTDYDIVSNGGVKTQCRSFAVLLPEVASLKKMK